MPNYAWKAVTFHQSTWNHLEKKYENGSYTGHSNVIHRMIKNETLLIFFLNTRVKNNIVATSRKIINRQAYHLVPGNPCCKLKTFHLKYSTLWSCLAPCECINSTFLLISQLRLLNTSKEAPNWISVTWLMCTCTRIFFFSVLILKMNFETNLWNFFDIFSVIRRWRCWLVTGDPLPNSEPVGVFEQQSPSSPADLCGGALDKTT